MEPLKSTHAIDIGYSYDDLPRRIRKIRVKQSCEKFLGDRFYRFIFIARNPKHRSYRSFKKGLSFDGSRYTVSLPWKQEIGTIPDNYILCEGRLRSLLKRLRENPILLKQYDDIIKQQEADGIVESVPSMEQEIGKVHCIPHREVVRDRETTRVRIVYDASAKVKERISLNDCLETGPCPLPKIFEILVRFRCFKYALTSDIKSAFLNIRVKEEDRDFLRFLWATAIMNSDPTFIIKRFTSVLFGLNSSPFLLGMMIIVHMSKHSETYKEVVETFLRDLYLDDSVSGCQTLSEAFELYFRSKKLMKEGGFRLLKWATNDQELMAQIKSSETNVFGEICEKYEERKILGILWNVCDDSLLFSLRDVIKGALENTFPTKRFILEVISSLFDPLGVYSPLVIIFKLFLQ